MIILFVSIILVIEKNIQKAEKSKSTITKALLNGLKVKKLKRKENIGGYYDWCLERECLFDEQRQNKVLDDYLDILINDPQRKAMEIFLKFGTGSVIKDTPDSMYDYLHKKFIPSLKPLNFRPSTKEECQKFLDEYTSKHTRAVYARDVISMRIICCKVRNKDVKKESMYTIYSHLRSPIR